MSDLEASITDIELRVRYAETDQMRLAHHANYLVWCEQARTEHMRRLGVSYRELEQEGIHLPVVEAALRYHRGARYDDALRVRCWVREASSRRVVFGYAIERVVDGALLATARTSLIAVDADQRVRALPASVRQCLVPVQDPVRLM